MYVTHKQIPSKFLVSTKELNNDNHTKLNKINNLHKNKILRIK